MSDIPAPGASRSETPSATATRDQEDLERIARIRALTTERFGALASSPALDVEES